MEPIQVGKYQLLDRIGTGGMAEVHLARVVGVRGFEKLVVVKRLLPALAEESDYVAQFIDEARLAATFSHANIVSTFDFGEADGSYYIAMEYVEGKNVRRIQDVLAKRGRGIPEPVAVHIVSELCRGLEYAHTRKDQNGRVLSVVHRDVSPQNVVVSYGGDVKVLDFGIAKSSSREFKTAAGIVKGKLRYMSPEQVANEDIDGRSDLFAAAVILWELLFGKRPMPEMPDSELVEWVRLGIFERPKGMQVRPELEHILARALAVQVETRYANCGEFARALSRYNSQAWPEFTPTDLVKLLEAEFSEDMQRERQWIAGILGGMPVPGEKSIEVKVALGAAPFAEPSPTSREALTVQTPSRGVQTMSRGISKSSVVPSAELPVVRGSAPGADSIAPVGGARKRNALPLLGIGGLLAVAVGLVIGFKILPGAKPAGTPVATPTTVSALGLGNGAATGTGTASPAGSATAAVVATPTAMPTPTALAVATVATATPRATPVRTAVVVRTAVPTATPAPTATQVASLGANPAKLSVSMKTGFGWGEVWIDGVKVDSETPLQGHRLAPGRHEVWIVRDGKKLYTEKLTLVAGEKRVVLFPQ